MISQSKPEELVRFRDGNMRGNQKSKYCSDIFLFCCSLNIHILYTPIIHNIHATATFMDIIFGSKLPAPCSHHRNYYAAMGTFRQPIVCGFPLDRSSPAEMTISTPSAVTTGPALIIDHLPLTAMTCCWSEIISNLSRHKLRLYQRLSFSALSGAEHRACRRSSFLLYQGPKLARANS